jgi:hypothetical protein
MVFANNAVYCDLDNFAISGLNGVAVTGNVIIPSTSSIPSGGYIVGRSTPLDFIDATGRNVYPTTDSKVIDAGTPGYVTAVDFNGTPRIGQPDAGAYTWITDQNPGWAIGPGFKVTTPPNAPRPAPPSASPPPEQRLHRVLT